MSARTKRIRRQRKREQRRIIGNCCNCEKPLKKEEAIPNFPILMWESISCLNCMCLYAYAREVVLLIKDLQNGNQILQDQRPLRLFKQLQESQDVSLG